MKFELLISCLIKYYISCIFNVMMSFLFSDSQWEIKKTREFYESKDFSITTDNMCVYTIQVIASVISEERIEFILVPPSLRPYFSSTTINTVSIIFSISTESLQNLIYQICPSNLNWYDVLPSRKLYKHEHNKFNRWHLVSTKSTTLANPSSNYIELPYPKIYYSIAYVCRKPIDYNPILNVLVALVSELNLKFNTSITQMWSLVPAEYTKHQNEFPMNFNPIIIQQ
ncbi:hypothetical protein AGLY_017046 [Aphis glycines]|uniref:Uncharacterized protein n=1 Tax=Aphis glycines TaxID=307491 RepID=A0A6G0SW12_APHGL|nr:hypothetical protein AGLY_017046 [Aphis glycines]